MSLRRFNPFASNSVINRRSSTSTLSSQPPSYTPALPPRRASTANHHRGVTVWSVDSDSLIDIPEFAPTERPAGPHYIYYRVYAEDGAIPSANQVYSDDPYLGRILAELVAPPHITISLKNCLLNIENIDHKTAASLYVATSSQTPMDDNGRISILAYPGPGCTPDEPMALVVKLSESSRSPLDEKKPEAILLPSPEGSTPFETRYMYYRVYKQQGAVLSKRPVDPNKPSVGRISVDSVPPPHTAETIMRCISKIEELDSSKESQLFADISSEHPIGNGHVSILSNDRLGSASDNPMAFVVDPVCASPPSSPISINVLNLHPTFKKSIRVTKGHVSDYRNPGWLTTTPGEILRTTDSPPQLQPWVRPNGSLCHYLAYKVVNRLGQVGFVYDANVKPC